MQTSIQRIQEKRPFVVEAQVVLPVEYIQVLGLAPLDPTYASPCSSRSAKTRSAKVRAFAAASFSVEP